MSIRNVAELITLRNELWHQVRALPGLITIGIGSKNGEVALVLFVDEKKVRREDLPVCYATVPIIVESAGRIKAHLAGRWMNA